MWKLIYKTFLVGILSGSIMMLDFQFKTSGFVSFNSARAEKFEAGGKEDGDMMSTLTMVGISVMASRLIQYGKVTPDIMAAAAGGAAFIAGDMMATKKLKEAMKKIEMDIQRSKTGDLTDQQRQALLKLRQSYMDAKETANTKKTLQMASAAAFALAAGLAYMASGMELAAETACTTALSTAPATIASGLSTCMGVCATEFATCTMQPACTTPQTVAACLAACQAKQAACQAKCNAENASCTTATTTVQTGMQSYINLRKAPKLSCPDLQQANQARGMLNGQLGSQKGACPPPYFTTAGTQVEAGCRPVFPMHIGWESGCLSPMMLYGGMAASVALMGITASTLVTAVVSFSAPLAQAIDTQIFIPMRRAMIWGVLAGLAFAASSATDNVIAKLDGYIQKIDALLKTFNMQGLGSLATNAANINNKGIKIDPLTGKPITIDSQNSSELDLGGKGATLPCITAKEGESCPSFSKTFDNLGNLSGLSDSMKTSVDDLKKLGDGVNGTGKISSTAMSAAGRLAANQNALNNNLKKYKSETFGKYKFANGKSFEQNENDLRNSMMGSMQSAILKNKKAAGEIYASLTGLTPGEMKVSDYGVNNSVSTSTKVGGVKGAVGGANAGAAPNGGFGDANLADENLDVSQAEGDKGDLAKLNSAEKLDGLEVEQNDIVKDKGVSIFEVISNRYLKSGYPRLFKRIKE